MHPVLADLISLLELERIEDNIFRGASRDIGSPQVFGGQVLGQALSAAQSTVDGRVLQRLDQKEGFFARPSVRGGYLLALAARAPGSAPAGEAVAVAVETGDAAVAAAEAGSAAEILPEPSDTVEDEATTVTDPQD